MLNSYFLIKMITFASALKQKFFENMGKSCTASSL